MPHPLDVEFWQDDQHRLWNYFETVQEVIAPIHSWPEWAQVQAVNLHKNDSQMYNFMYFLIINGVSPSQAVGWTLANTVRGMKSPYVVLNPPVGYARYTQKEYEDCLRVKKKAEEGKLISKSKRVYDLIKGRPEWT